MSLFVREHNAEHRRTSRDTSQIFTLTLSRTANGAFHFTILQVQVSPDKLLHYVTKYAHTSEPKM